ncbi:unnamed protein product, partial [Prorocentrum cordatum]
RAPTGVITRATRCRTRCPAWRPPSRAPRAQTSRAPRAGRRTRAPLAAPRAKATCCCYPWGRRRTCSTPAALQASWTWRASRVAGAGRARPTWRA